MTLSTACTLAISRLYQSTDQTRTFRRQHATWLLNYFGDCNVSDITHDGICLWVDHERDRGLKMPSIHKRLGTLSLALNAAKRSGKLDTVPEFPRISGRSTPRTTFLTRSEFATMCRRLPPRQQVWACIGVYTAMHSSDISSMTWDDVDLIRGRFLRRNTKNKTQPLWLPMPRKLVECLAVWKQNATYQTREIVGKWAKSSRDLSGACARAGINKKICALDLRRTFATWWLESSADKFVLRTWMGHSSQSQMVELVYAQCTTGMVGGGLERFDKGPERTDDAL